MTITAEQVRAWESDIDHWRGRVRERDAEIERLRSYIWSLDGMHVCTASDDGFIDEGIVVASDHCPLPSHDQQKPRSPNTPNGRGQ